MKTLKYKHLINTFIMAISASVILLSCQDKTEKTVAETATNTLQTVGVIRPEKRSFTAEILIVGTAKPNQKVTVYAMESGYLKSIRKDIGDTVSKGEVVAQLENPTLLQEQLKLKAQLQAKEAIYNRLKSIYEKTPALTSLQMVEEAESGYLSAKANLDAINSRIGFLTIRAPFSGVVTKRFVDHGALLQNGLDEDNPQGIVEIQETNPIRLTLPLPESDASAVKIGTEALVTFPELPGEEFSAKVSRISNALDDQSKTMQAELDIENKEGKILPNMYAKVLIRVSSRENILSLPIISQVRFKNEPFVLVVKDGVVEQVPVRIGLSDKNHFEVLNADINAESQVIIEGKGLVKPGQSVEPILKQE